MQGTHPLRRDRVAFSWEASGRYQRLVQYEHYVDAVKRSAMEEVDVDLVERLPPRALAGLYFGVGGGVRVRVPESSVSVALGVRLDLAYQGREGMAAPSVWEEVRFGGRSR
jgi:hypothetical protein